LTERAASLEREAGPGLFIGGAYVGSADGSELETLNPATGEVLAGVSEAKAADVDRAVGAARSALTDSRWAGLDAADRGTLLWRLADAIEGRAGALARLETLDNGKPIRESQIDIRLTVDVFRYYAGWTTKLEGATIPVRGNVLNYTVREPVGVVGAIIPWNFPLLMAAYKLGPALACGNTVVLKPAEQTPLSALELGAIANSVGLPPGVLNVLPGYGEVAGAALVAHPGVDKIAFTGSTEVGRRIMREAAATLKKVSLELGGKSPNIVLADADLESAARGAFAGIFYNMGQCCTAGSRLLVAASVKQELLERIVARARQLQPGDPLNPKTRMGPLVSAAQLERVLGYVERGRSEGAELLTGGGRATYEGEARGFWLQPTVFDKVRAEHSIAQEEIFGPVLATLSFEDEDEAVALANSTIYGLAAGVWTRRQAGASACPAAAGRHCLDQHVPPARRCLAAHGTVRLRP
jgi:acyl-CoA reductase-like NAD-dependent aldehyde dehydrogenase